MFEKKYLAFLLALGLLCTACGTGEKSVKKYVVPNEEIKVAQEDLFTAQEVAKRWPLKKREANTPRITGICYHEVLDDPKDGYAIPPRMFRQHLREFKAAGYNFVDVSDLKAYVEQQKPLPKNPLFISFDDGYLNNYTYAYPILKAEGAKATFFLVAGSMCGKNRMTWSQMKEMLADGMQFGCHTMNHEFLVGMTPAQLKVELVDSKKMLEDKLGTEIYAIAYPCGYATPEVLAEVKKSYKLGFYANVDPEREETIFTFNRFGVYKWNNHIDSIFKQKQPKLKKKLK